jgi:hypothetical protein
MKTHLHSCIVGVVLLSRVGYAEPPYAGVTFQGRLTNTNGIPVSNGSYDMVFNFYDAPTAGTLLLTDRHVAPNGPVPVSAALFSVLLGGGEFTAGVETNLWNVFLHHPEVYLGITVDAESEMIPRLPLTRAPYAVQAQNALNLAGAPASQYLQLASNGSMTVTGTATIMSNIVTSGRYKFSTPQLGRITLGPADFVARHPSEEQYVLWGYPWKANRHYLVCTMTGGSASFHAEVRVPEGATLTKLVSYIYDADIARSSTLNLARCSLYGHLGPDPVYLATNTSVDNQVRTEKVLSEVVNTTTNHYVLSLQLFWSDLGMQFLGAQVEYTYNELRD